MTISNDYPTIDGFAPSWADIIIRATPDGAPLIDMKQIKSINTGTTVELGEQRGASGGRVMKRTRGATSHDAGMVLYAGGLYELQAGLLALMPRRGNEALISLVHFGIQIQWTPPGSDLIFEKRMKGCRIIGDTEASAEGVDAAEIDVPLSVIQICRVVNGVEVVML